MHETGCSGLVPWDDPGGWDGEGGGRGVLNVPMADSCRCMAKTTTIFKVISLQIARIYNGLKTISLTSGAGKSGQPLVKE